MRTLIRFVLAGAILWGAAANAQTTPTATTHAWTILGAKNHGGLRTAITCTNSLPYSVIVGVDVHGPSGSLLASSDQLTVMAGETVVFTTGIISAYDPADSLILTGFYEKGYALVLTNNTNASRARRVLCSAVLSDSTNTPPIALTSLPVVRKNIQAGQ